MNKKRSSLLIIIILSSILFIAVDKENPLVVKAAPMGVQLEWSFLTGGDVLSSPAVADLDLDGDIEVVVGSSDTKVYCLNSTGGLEWSFQTWENRLKHSSPCIVDVDGDNKFEILIGTFNASSDNGALYCINDDGTLEWMNVGYRVYSTPAVADLDDDGTLEILLGRSGELGGGWLQCLDHLGVEEWIQSLGGIAMNSPCIIDLENDGTLEIIIGSDRKDGKINCFNSSGSLEWFNYPGPGDTMLHSSPSVADLDKDGTMEILANMWETSSDGGGLYYFNHLGNYESIVPGNNWVVNLSSPIIADIDGDSSLEILVGCLDTAHDPALACYDVNGNREWASALSGDNEVEATPSVADLDNDGKMEVLIGTKNNSFYCFNATGEIDWTYTTGDSIESSACIADLDGDGILEILFGSNDNYLYCLKPTGVSSSGNQRWWGFKGSVSKTGNIDTDGDYLDDCSEDFYEANYNLTDTDSDGLQDGLETYLYVTSPNNTDSDGDTLTDGDEVYIYNTSPRLVDTDSDGMTDGWEIQYNLDPLTNDSALDPDNDNLSNIEEFIYSTNPRDEDTDTDGLEDGYEVKDSLTSPTDADSDDDGLTDGEEVIQYNTNPNSNDTDDDGLTDWEELFDYYTNVTNSDTDNDGLLDGEEVNDYATDPKNHDSDDDGLSDRDEIIFHETDPNDNDTDSDGLLDGWEITFYLTDPNNPDSDGDGYNDRLEIESGSDPNDPNSKPVINEFHYPIGWSFMLLAVLITILFTKIRRKKHNHN